MAGFLIRWSLCSALVLIAAPAMAQRVMADPTRPPGNVVMDSQAAVDVSGPVLQSVLIPKKGRPVAVIGGQQVRLGENYGESRLVRLSEREAVLEGPSGTERLSLTPGVEKIAIRKSSKEKTTAAEGGQRGGKP